MNRAIFKCGMASWLLAQVVADGTALKLPLLAGRAAGSAHPFVTGHEGFRRWATTLKSCAAAFLP